MYNITSILFISKMMNQLFDYSCHSNRAKFIEEEGIGPKKFFKRMKQQYK